MKKKFIVLLIILLIILLPVGFYYYEKLIIHFDTITMFEAYSLFKQNKTDEGFDKCDKMRYCRGNCVSLGVGEMVRTHRRSNFTVSTDFCNRNDAVNIKKPLLYGRFEDSFNCRDEEFLKKDKEQCIYFVNYYNQQKQNNTI